MYVRLSSKKVKSRVSIIVDRRQGGCMLDSLSWA